MLPLQHSREVQEGRAQIVQENGRFRVEKASGTIGGGCAFQRSPRGRHLVLAAFEDAPFAEACESAVLEGPV